MPDQNSTPKPIRLNLTSDHIEALKTTGKRYRAWDTKVQKLCVMVQASGRKAWYVNFRSPVTGQGVDYRIGPASIAPTTARKKAEAILGQVANGEDPQANKIAERREREAEKLGTGTLEVFIRDHYWPDHLAHRPSGRATRERIEYAWPMLLKKKITDITELDIQRVRRARLKKVTPQTWNRDRAALGACLNFAIKHGHLAMSPVKPSSKADEVDENRVRYLGQRDEVERFEQGEEARFWAACARAPDRLRVLATMAMKTGARRGELFALTWGAVSLEQGTITLEARTTKSRKKRTVPLPSTVADMLRAWKPANAKAGDLVVPSPVTGGRIYTLKKAWRAMLQDAQITGFRWHDMRHHYASKLVQGDVSIFTVSTLLGHSDPALTAKRYADLAPDHMRDAVELLA